MLPDMAAEAFKREFEAKDYEDFGEIGEGLRALMAQGVTGIISDGSFHSTAQLAMSVEGLDKMPRIFDIKQVNERMIPDVLGLHEKIEAILRKRPIN